MSTTGDEHQAIGNYYNWTAAVAMNNSSRYSANGTVVDQSICPAGWTLPNTDGEIGSFYYLFDKYGISDKAVMGVGSPLYTTFSGIWTGSSSEVGADVFFWSPKVESTAISHSAGLGYTG